MNSEVMGQIMQAAWYTTLFTGDFEESRRQNSETSLAAMFSQFVNKHPDLRGANPPFSPLNQALPISLAYIFIVLPFESDEKIAEWPHQINSLNVFNLLITPDGFDRKNTGHWLKYLRHSFAHANVDLDANIEATNWLRMWNHQSGNKRLKRNFEATCSANGFMEFLNEYVKKYIEEWRKLRMLSS